MFFVISGFVIPYSIARAFPAYSLKDYPTYLIRRMTRIEPPYFVSVLLVIGLAYLSSWTPGFRGVPPDYGLTQVLSHLLYVTPLVGEEWIQPVYWTLAYEFVFYLTIGLLFPWVQRYGTWMLWGGVSVLALLTEFELVSARVWLFMLGLLAYCRLSSDCESVRPGVTGWLMALSVLLMSRHAEAAWVVVGVLTVSFILFMRERHLPGRPAKWLVWLGGLSYSLYLLHVPIGGRVVNLGHRFVEEEWQMLLVSLMGLVVSLLAALLFHRWIERPAMRLARQIRPGARTMESAVRGTI